MRTVRVLSLLLLAMFTLTSVAQERGERGERGNWDPAQMQERMLNMQKEHLAISDQDWEAIKPLFADILDKQRAVRELQFRGMVRGARGGAERAQPAAVEAVNKALESNDVEGIKKSLTALRAARQASEAELKKAQDNLREVLTVQQEARLVLAGLLE